MTTVFGLSLQPDAGVDLAVATPFGRVVVDIAADGMVDDRPPESGRVGNHGVARRSHGPMAAVETLIFPFDPPQSVDHPGLQAWIVLTRVSGRSNISGLTLTAPLTTPFAGEDFGPSTGERLQAWEADDGTTALAIGDPMTKPSKGRLGPAGLRHDGPPLTLGPPALVCRS